jgi:hypothetical protein
MLGASTGQVSLKTVASELIKYNLDLVAIQEVDGLRVVNSQQMIIHFFIEMSMIIVI